MILNYIYKDFYLEGKKKVIALKKADFNNLQNLFPIPQ